MGQLGDGTTTSRSVPVPVVGLPGPVQAIVAGFYQTCALTGRTGEPGGVFCWGAGSSIGGPPGGSPTAAAMPGLAGGVIALAAGDYYTCAALAGGSVRCWGRNTVGQLGNGTQIDSPTPVAVVGLSGVKTITAAGATTCALTATGRVKCWGDNAVGQLGDGTTKARNTPVDTGLSDVQAVRTGARTCALLKSGRLKCWGDNYNGELGVGSSNPIVTAPADVVAYTGQVRAFALGRAACVVTPTGGLQCWGSTVGDGSTCSQLTSTPVAGLASGVVDIAGGINLCATTVLGTVSCWGDWVQTMPEAVYSAYAPMAVPAFGSSVHSLGLGASSSCAVAESGVVGCAGHLPPQACAAWQPAAVPGLAANITQVALAPGHACALSAGGDVQCWGDNGFGELGDGTQISRTVAAAVTGLTQGVRAITVAGIGFEFGGYSCALTATGGVKCWGANQYGQLGDGTLASRTLPVDVSGLAAGVVGITGGERHACALTMVGGVTCWGDNGAGQLGIPTATLSSTTPVGVTGLANSVQAIAAGGFRTCALLADGRVQCWGGGDPPAWMPADVPGLVDSVQALALGANHACVLTAGGAQGGGVKCWGLNRLGQLGINNPQLEGSATPMEVTGLSTGVRSIWAGGDGACAQLLAGGIRCWGSNMFGQLGLNPGWSPTEIPGLVANDFLPQVSRR